jgi:hypothetical protein
MVAVSTISASRNWHIYNNISETRSMLPNCIVSKIRRSCNTAAHNLAQLARNSSRSIVWLDPVPEAVKEMCNHDSVYSCVRDD